MANHFACIGLPVASEGDLRALVERVLGQCTEEAREGAVRHLRWTDGSGASLALHLRNGELVCLTPFFDPPGGLRRWNVSSTAPHDDTGCEHCGGADVDILENGETVTRATIQWLHYRPHRAWLGARRTYALEVAAFAHELTTFPDEASYLSGQDEPKYAPNAFLPTGMFGPGADMGQAAMARFAGRIASVERPTTTGGGPFWRLQVETLPGCIDVVAPPDVLEGPPQVGGTALVGAWLVGRPVVTPARAGWLDRLLGR